MSNKTQKYLFYAIGEIALVMIGILLALQVNNWNEENRLQAEEKILLINLKTDFESRLNELKEFEAVRAKRFIIIENLAEIIGNQQLPDDIAVMDTMMADLNNLLIFNDQFKVLDILFYTGKIDQINNQNLKALLLNWPQIVEEMMEEQRIRLDINFEYFIPLQFKYLSFRQVIENYTFRDYSMSNGWGRNKESDYEGLIADPIFENHIAHTEILHRVNEQDYKVLIENAEQIIELLTIELEGR